MLAAGQPAATPVFPLAALPSTFKTTSTAAFPLAENPHQGVRTSSTERYRRLLAGNLLSALGNPECLYDSGRRSRSTGKERDAETGLDYFGARYFSAAQGRFTSPDLVFADQHASNPQSWNLYTYSRNNPLRLVDIGGFKVIEAVKQEALAKMANMSGGGVFYLDFAGIRGFHNHPSISANSFNRWHANHSAANEEVMPNERPLHGLLAGLFGKTNKDQGDTAKAIIAATPGNINIAFDTYSNGVNAAGSVARGLDPGSLASATIVAPNTANPDTLRAIDDADGGAFNIYQSSRDPALGSSLFGSQSTSSLTQEFGADVHISAQPSHNLDKYANENHMDEGAKRLCGLGNPAACGP